MKPSGKLGQNFRSPWPFSKKIYNLPMQNFFPSNRNWCRQKAAVTTAEAELAEILKMRESAPKVLEEKEKSLLDAQNQLKVRENEFTEFKKKVDLQKSKTEALLQQYLEALPK
jgi:transcription termination factor NusB